MSHNPTPTFSLKGSEPGRHPEPEVVSRATRRTFSAAYKLRIVEEADQCVERGQIGAMLRREGLYSSQLATWRREREAAGLQAMAPKKRGRKADQDAKDVEIATLRRENEGISLVLEQKKDTGHFRLFWMPKSAKMVVFNAILMIPIRNLTSNQVVNCRKTAT